MTLSMDFHIFSLAPQLLSIASSKHLPINTSSKIPLKVNLIMSQIIKIIAIKQTSLQVSSEMVLH